MLPNNRLSTLPKPSTIIGPRGSSLITPKFDQDMGGIAIGDTSQGLSYQVWTCQTVREGILLSAENTEPFLIYEDSNINECSLSFDRNMDWVIAFAKFNKAKLSWFNTASDRREIVDLNGTNPRVFYDDKRPNTSEYAEVLCFYIRNGKLYHRRQRDRYAIEYELFSRDLEGNPIYIHKLNKVGMGTNLRIQISVDYIYRESSNKEFRLQDRLIHTSPILIDGLLE